MKSEKILVYSDSFFIVSQTFIYEQVKCLTDKYEVHLTARTFDNPHNYDLTAFKYLKLKKPINPFDRLAGRLIRKYYNFSLDINLKIFLKLRKLLKSGDCKAIHAHFGPRALDILGLAKNFEVPLVVSFHGYDASRMLENSSYVNKLPELFEYASAIILSSMHMATNLNLDPDNKKVHYIPYGVNPEFFKGGAKKSSNNGIIKILHSGRLVGKKGVPDLIKVFNELSEKYEGIQLQLVGDGEELNECKELVKKFGIEDKVSFYGAVPHEKVKSIMNDADIFVLNSRKDRNGDMEGTPVTILEAMCMGKAVLSTRHAGIAAVIDHGENGLLAEENTNDDLKKNLETLIVAPELRLSLGREAEKTISSSYSKKIMQDKIQRVFESI